MWPGGAVCLYGPTCVGLRRTVARANNVRGEGLFGVGHMLGDQLLVGVLGGDEVPDPVPGLEVRGAVWDGYATTEGGFDAGPLAATAGEDKGRQTAEATPAAARDGILARQRFGRVSMGGVVRRRRVLPWGALSDRELMGTARQRAWQSSGVDAPPGWWVAAQVLYGWVVVPDGDPHGVLTGAVAAQVVAADLRAPSRAALADRPWVAAVTEAADAAVCPHVVQRRRAGLRLLLAVTEAAEGDPEVELAEAVAVVLTARTPPEHRRAVRNLTNRLDADPHRYNPVLASAWVLVFGPTLLGVLDEVSDQLGLLRTGKPPLRAAALRRAQHTTVHQLHATGQVSTRTLIGMAGVALGTIQRWIHHPPAVTVQGSSPTRAGRVADSAVMGGKRSGHLPRAPAGPGCPHGPGPMTARTQATHTRWQQGLSRLRAYAQAHGGANPPTTAVVDGFRLGRWAAVQRERYWANRLPPDHLTALQAVPGWDWGRTNADRWSEGLTHLRSYLDEHGSTAVDTHTVHEGFELGAWVTRRRANYHQGTLSPTRIAVLEALAGWVWTRTDDQWPPA